MKKTFLVLMLLPLQFIFFLWITGCNSTRPALAPQSLSKKIQARVLLVPDGDCDYNTCFGPPFYTYASEGQFPTPLVPCISNAILTTCATQIAQATITITPLANTPTPTITPTNTPCPHLPHTTLLVSYKQSDSRWNTISMPNEDTAIPGNTIGSIGCLLTCCSMMDGRDPHQLDDLFTHNNLIAHTGDLRTDLALPFLHNALFNNLVINQRVFDTSLSLDITSSIDSLFLTRGNQYVIALILNFSTGKTHFVQVVDKKFNPTTKQCDYEIFDPAQRNFTFLSQYNNESPYFLFALYGVEEF